MPKGVEHLELLVREFGENDIASFIACDEFFQKHVHGRDDNLVFAGVSDPWLALARSFIKPSIALETLLVQEKEIERERWRLMKGLYPRIESQVGKESASLLDRGVALDAEALCNRAFYRKGYAERLLEFLLSTMRALPTGSH
jgi:hypothetical protein